MSLGIFFSISCLPAEISRLAKSHLVTNYMYKILIVVE